MCFASHGCGLTFTTPASAAGAATSHRMAALEPAGALAEERPRGQFLGSRRALDSEKFRGSRGSTVQSFSVAPLKCRKQHAAVAAAILSVQTSTFSHTANRLSDASLYANCEGGRVGPTGTSRPGSFLFPRFSFLPASFRRLQNLRNILIQHIEELQNPD